MAGEYMSLLTVAKEEMFSQLSETMWKILSSAAPYTQMNLNKVSSPMSIKAMPKLCNI